MQEAARHAAICKLDVSCNVGIGRDGLELLGQQLPDTHFIEFNILNGVREVTVSRASQDAVCRALSNGLLRRNTSLLNLDLAENFLGTHAA